MATITVSLPEEFDKAKSKFPEINWNEVIKQGILKRLTELKKFEELKKRGVLRNENISGTSSKNSEEL